MIPLQAFKELLHHNITTTNGKVYSITPLNPLSAAEIEALAQHLPGQRLPDDIIELLRFASGFSDNFFDEFSFVNADGFGLEHFFPNVIELASDGTGNLWLQDIDYQGNWGAVYYACHDPAVIMKQADSLADFIKQIHDYALDENHSFFHQLYEDGPIKIWKLPKGGFISIEEAKKSSDKILKDFASQLPPDYLIADLRNKPVGAGFAWGRYYSIMDKEIRCSDLPLWGIQPKKRNFFARIFNWR